MRCLVALLIILSCCCPAYADHHTISVQQACYGEIQGRIPWDHSGSRNWNDDNIYALCAGTRNAAEPGRCFSELMHGGGKWAGNRRWNWENAIALCRGSNDATWTVTCFRQGLRNNLDWGQAITHCADMSSDYQRYPDYGFSGRHQQRDTCPQLVQGRIAWNYEGDTIWADRYLTRLCSGSKSPAEPGRCYDQVMHGGVNWGGGTRWEPDNVLNLCAGTSNAERTIRCFDDAVYRGTDWESAIAHCSR